MITIEDLRASYGKHKALDGITFEARPGAVFGLLGPNGAGKSTTIACVSGLIRPDQGSVRVLGHDVVREPRVAKARLGIVPQELALYEDMSARENLGFWGSACGVRGAALRERASELLERTGLSDRADEPVKGFSEGMRRRLNFACGIVHRPRVLLLDEPTVGIDPQARARLLELIREEAHDGVCVLYTTHNMDEAEDLCDRIAILDHGRLIALGSLEELRALHVERDLVRLQGNFEPARVEQSLRALRDVELLHADENHLTVALHDAQGRLPALFGALSSAGAIVRETTLSRPSLENLFIKLTGTDLRD